jgi:genome maintenance exonuclease 1
MFKHITIPEIDELQKHIQAKTQNTGRVYAVSESEYYPSITTVLGHSKRESLKEWRARVGEEEANRITRKAAVNGTKIHNLVEKALNNEHIDLSEETPLTTLSFQALDKVLREKVGTIYATECAMYSKYLGVAGRVDCIGIFNDRLSIIDFKTSRRTKEKHQIENYFMQETAYAIMFEEQTGIPVKQIVTLMVVNGETTPQIFVEDRDNWVEKLQKAIQKYRDEVLLS